MQKKQIPIIDVFAGPGGLGEGFTAFKENSQSPFKIAVSVEKDPNAHSTLLLRAFVRQFDCLPRKYYDYLKGKITKTALYEAYPLQHTEAKKEAWLAELGAAEFPHDIVTKKIRRQLGKSKECILIGGPPCQAYSLAGRVRMKANPSFHEDPRHTLYLEYLQIIAEFQPLVFVMENVKGILSSTLEKERIFPRIRNDLSQPGKVFSPYKKLFKVHEKYTLYSLVVESDTLADSDFIIKSELYGIPQARHRVIILGVRNDIKVKPKVLTPQPKQVSVAEVIDDLPQVRSGISKACDSYKAWAKSIKKLDLPNIRLSGGLTRGSEYVPSKNTQKPKVYSGWYYDSSIGGVINHSTRAHIEQDLHRYYFMAANARQTRISIKLGELPNALLPKHKNISADSIEQTIFSDRFRVQLAHKAATTITSHISKDGHYYIHYDPKQCRSLTVREAARIQTFPDNYKFEGPRTAQYQQVGNAVPPLLAKQIAYIVYDLLKRHGSYT